MAFYQNFVAAEGTTPDQLGFTQFVATAVTKPYVSSNRLRSALSSGTSYWFTSIDSTDHKVDVTVTSYGGGTHWLYVRFQGTTDYHGLRIASGTGALRLYKRVGNVDIGGFVAVPGTYTMPSRFKLVVEGAKRQVFVNDMVTPVYTDFLADEPTPAGSPGFAINNNASFTAIELDNYYAALPAESLPTSPGFSSVVLSPIIQPLASYIGGPDAPALVSDYFIDFLGGSDTNPGTRTQPWKHHPNDTAVDAGSTAALAVTAGKTFAFKAGVDYQGTIVPQTDGQVLLGKGYGAGRAHLSGWEPIVGTFTDASADSVLAENPVKANIEKITLGSTPSIYQIVRCGSAVCFPAQSPTPDDLALMTDTRAIAENHALEHVLAADATYLPGTDKWTFKMPVTAALLGSVDPVGMKVVAITEPNASTYTHAVTDRVGDLITVDGFPIDPPNATVGGYPDVGSTGKFKLALIGHPQFIRKPGQFALVGDVLYIWRPNVDPAFISTRKRGINNDLQKSIEVRGFRGSGFWGTESSQDGGHFFYTPNKPGAAQITIEDNIVHSCFSPTHVGAIQTNGIKQGNVDVRKNFFHQLYGKIGGWRIGGPGQLIAEYNAAFEVSNTGGYVAQAQGGRMSHNFVAILTSVHGNGLSVYQDSKDFDLEYNLVITDKKGITLDNSAAPDMIPNNIRVRFNLAPIYGPVQFWSSNERPLGILLENNTGASGRPDEVNSGYYIGYPSVDNMIRGNILSGLIKNPLTDGADYTTSRNYFPEGAPNAPLTAGGGDKVVTGTREIWYQSLDQASPHYMRPIPDGPAQDTGNTYGYYGALRPDGAFADGEPFEFWPGLGQTTPPTPDPPAPIGIFKVPFSPLKRPSLFATIRRVAD